MSILAIAVAYNPDPDALRLGIESYADQVDHILLWRNSPVEFSHPKVELCGDCTNKGLGTAYNYAAQYARDHGYEYLLTMDQDSRWVDFEGFLRLALAPGAPKGPMGPVLNDELIQEDYLQSKDTIINSGQIVSTELVFALGGWRTDFQVDGVDIDFCIRAKLNGYPCYQLSSGRLIQPFGNCHRVKRLGRLITVYDYPAKRLYHIYRNTLMVIRSYPGTKNFRKMFLKDFYTFRLPRLIFGEHDRPRKLLAIAAGTWSGLTSRIPTPEQAGIFRLGDKETRA